MPKSNRFGPMDARSKQDCIITMTIEEYETIRLIDLEGFTQEECAAQMSIARTTVQGIYNAARKKLSESLVNGKTLHIEGGNYKLCDSFEKPCLQDGCCRRRRCESDTPKVENGEVQ
ncbi:putative DNA-binding protein (UPF0251 family) [Mesobacillus stamsii]|nr:putative DNA-binding protein (UPF0251 family) [Mesobacillus stamsii]